MFTKPVKKALSRLWENNNNDAAIQILKEAYRAAEENDHTILNAWTKAISKQDKYSHESQAPEGLINAWEQCDWESWKHVFILEGNDLEKAHTAMYHAGYAVDGFSSRYAGQAFCNPMYFSQAAPNRILVTQRGGLDV